MGIKTDKGFFDVTKWHQKELVVSAEPVVNDHYFEWISVLTAVHQASSRFTMIELGAGYAPWLVAAAVALRQLGKEEPLLVAVEAEPKRYEYIFRHFNDNQIKSADNVFFKAAVVPEDFEGDAWFLVGDPTNTYGARLVADQNFGYRKYRHGFQISFAKFVARLRNLQRPEPVRCVKMSSILAIVPQVDLLDMDIQSAELDVVASCIGQLNNKVKYVHIGTHSESIEKSLRKIFKANGWTNVFDYECRKEQSTPYGNICFDDGVQAWLNPRLSN